MFRTLAIFLQYICKSERLEYVGIVVEILIVMERQGGRSN